MCIPLLANCYQSAPEFIINNEKHMTWNDATSSNIKESREINHVRYQFCFKNITENVVLVEFCNINPICTQFCSILSGESVITTRAKVLVLKGKIYIVVKQLNNVLLH